MKYKIVYNMANGLPEKAFENRKRPGEYLFPGGCIEEKAPEFDSSTHTCKYVDGSWVVEEIPPEPEIEMPEEAEEPASEAPELTLVEEPSE